MRALESLHPTNISCTPLEKSATPSFDASLSFTSDFVHRIFEDGHADTSGRKKLETPGKHVKQAPLA
jgi:hypothetical protein